jgi:uncharacterized membrane protein (DUF4010 family)
MNTPFFEPVTDPTDAAIRLVIAAILGLAVGIERQWSGHASGPEARFAGMRTFLIMGIISGTAGLLAASGQVTLAAVLVIGLVASAVAAFIVVHNRPHMEVDGTTETAAIAIAGLGLLAGGGQLALAAGATAAIVFALGEKEQMHSLVERVSAQELRAAARFAVMALVILPLLPAAKMSWLGGLSLRELWMLVLVFSAVNFVGYLLQRAVGPDRGFGVAGLVGGLVSSTAVTLQFARRSRGEVSHSVALARGTVAASTIVPARLAIIAAAISPEVAWATLPYLVGPTLVGVGVLLTALVRPEGSATGEAETSSPLNLWSSMKLAAFFAVALGLVDWVGSKAHPGGILASAALLGIPTTDALTLSMARFGAGGPVDLAAKAIAVGVISNTLFKLVLAIGGTATYRRYAVSGLGLMIVATAAGWLVAG